MQRDEAALLLGLVCVIRPRVIVEFGFAAGLSAWNFLMALDGDGHLHSYDISDEARRVALTGFSRYRNFTYHHKAQNLFDSQDVGGQEVDFVFFDAAHNLSLNQETYFRVLPQLSPGALIVVHDTGLWAEDLMQPIHRKHLEMTGLRVSPGSPVAHQPGERAFVQWLAESPQTWAAVHFHSLRRLRNGVSVLQRRGVL